MYSKIPEMAVTEERRRKVANRCLHSKLRSCIEIPLRRYPYVTIVLISATFRETTTGKSGRRNSERSPRLQTEERRCLWRRTRIRPGQPDTSDLPGKPCRPDYRQRRILTPTEEQPVVQQDEIRGGGEYQPLLVENRQDARKIGAGLEGLEEPLSQVTVRRAAIAKGRFSVLSYREHDHSKSTARTRTPKLYCKPSLR